MPTNRLADLSRSFRRHRGGRAGWFLQLHRDELRVKSSDLLPRPGESGSPAARSATLRSSPGPATVKDVLEEASSAALAGFEPEAKRTRRADG